MFDDGPMHSMYGSGMGVWMLIWWLLAIAALFGFTIFVRNQRFTGNGKTPMDYLKERYAKGEINKQEFESMKRDLLS